MEETPAEEADRVSKLSQITRWVCETPTPLASKASIQQTMANTTLASSDSTLPNFPDLQRTRGLVKEEEQLEHFSSKDTITQTSSDPALPDLPSMPTSLVRNNYRDSADDYLEIMDQLQLNPDWYSTFYDVMKCYRYGEEVRAWLEDADEDIREVSEDFLDTYGRKFWLRAGNSNRQDKKYKHFWFNWKDDEHKLLPLLDELFTTMRGLLYRASSEPVTPLRASPAAPPSPLGVGELVEDEEEIVAAFFKKVQGTA